ncbi:hypothetical protein [Ulvibacter litoralis]|uniref:DUF4129 domain-containing protein n=1 Tax=Ulvibacter litoralis TaxID=227084 RepID=A0A1G7EYP6_9FLAO|nr:hypothetical protein [Ulvibacter litoralis]GHC53379.1 hypothetical protein GCM10008083_16730 [Ulvibacter litoralis]SDE68823.1 hypothetical protein SAMN05421855_102226 [Ulvibacter litoralis]
MNKFNFIVFFIFLKGFAGQELPQDSITVATNTDPFVEKSFSEDLASKYNGADFKYDEVEGETQNFLARALSWFFKKLENLFGVELSPEVYDVLEFLVYLLLAVLVGYFILKMFLGNDVSSFFNRKSAAISPLTIKEEHIESVDLDAYIADALAQKNYRLAIRYMYLKSLKELSLENIITWHFDKTNSDYYNEIENTEVKSSFKKVSYLYDYVWYGEFTLDETGFTNAQKDFDRLTQHLKNAR